MAASVKPKTLAKYRLCKDAYVVPLIGETALQDLMPVRLNLLYGHLLEKGRVHQRGKQARACRGRRWRRCTGATPGAGRCGALGLPRAQRRRGRPTPVGRATAGPSLDT
nr:hypothetical protein [Pseudofrankia sp. DC12]